MKKSFQKQPRGKSGHFPAGSKPKEARKTLNRLLHILGIMLMAFLAPILVINLILFADSQLNPDKAPELLGITPMIVMTNSMDPVITGGDMILIRKADPEEVKLGDIISYYSTGDDGHLAVITHRVMEIRREETGTLVFTTKGDANNMEDAPVSQDRLVGIYRKTIPFFGQAALFLRTVPGIALCIFLPFLLLAAFDALTHKKELKHKNAELELLQQQVLQNGKKANLRMG